jgi:hypothetical protein
MSDFKGFAVRDAFGRSSFNASFDAYPTLSSSWLLSKIANILNYLLAKVHPVFRYTLSGTTVGKI